MTSRTSQCLSNFDAKLCSYSNRGVWVKVVGVTESYKVFDLKNEIEK